MRTPAPRLRAQSGSYEVSQAGSRQGPARREAGQGQSKLAQNGEHRAGQGGGGAGRTEGAGGGWELRNGEAGLAGYRWHGDHTQGAPPLPLTWGSATPCH